jgi:hypothetical protein
MTTVAFPAARPALSYWSAAAPVAAPSGRVVAAVLQFGDLWETRQDGTTLIRFSAERLEREDVALVLDVAERRRAADISLVWDDEECQLLQVLDLAPLRTQALAAAGPTGNSYADTRMRGFPRFVTAEDSAEVRIAAAA